MGSTPEVWRTGVDFGCAVFWTFQKKTEKITAVKAKAKELKAAITKAATEAQTVNTLIDDLNTIQDEIISKQQDIHSNSVTIERLQKSIHKKIF